MFNIDKQFHFEYGHRVWSQQLNEEFCAADDTKCACRHLHGHSGKIHVYASSEELRDGMVTDFKHLGWLKDFFDEHLDHKFIIDVRDPLFERIVGAAPTFLTQTTELLRLQKAGPEGRQYAVAPIRVVPGGNVYAWKPVVKDVEDPAEREFLEGFTFVNFLPTAEHFCAWVHALANEKMKRLGVRITQVDWCETAKSRSSYTG